MQVKHLQTMRIFTDFFHAVQAKESPGNQIPPFQY